MSYLLEAGPFSARDGEGRELFAAATVRLPAGVLASLEGPSGSGKSSLLRQLVGLAPAPDAIRVLAGEPFGPSQLPAFRAAVTLLAQDAPQVPGTVRDNLELPFRLRAGSGRRFDPAQGSRLLEEVGLGGIPLEREVRTLSGGERHRLALARGLLWDPPVLVADEPLAALDPDTARACFEQLLARAHREGRAVLAVLHSSELAARADLRLRLGQHGLEAAS